MPMRDSSNASLSRSQIADSLQWISFTFILVFLAQLISTLFPIALLQPEWMVRVSSSLRGTANLPIIALALIMLANIINKNVKPTSQHLNLLRRIASLAAVGFLLLIPLQTYGTLVGIRSELKQGEAQLGSLVSAAKLVQNASNEQELRSAIRAIPGGEELAIRPLGAEVQKVRTALLERLRESTNRLQNQLNDTQNKVLQSAITPLIRDGVIAFAYAIGFASMGYSHSGEFTPLTRLFKGLKLKTLKGLRGTSKSVSGSQPKHSPRRTKSNLRH